MVRTIIRNLLANAVKFSFKNNKIYLCVEKRNDEAITRISDRGTGISEEEIKILFKKTAHKSKTGTEGEKGTGLGLGICKIFTDMNKGRIWAEKNKGNGSTFCFTIPLDK